MKKVLITGANGQLGKCLKDTFPKHQDIEVDFLTKTDLDITDEAAITAHFRNKKYDYCVNTAAYTNVEKAESEETKAFLINATGVEYLAKACKKQGVVFIQISTDYVFDGNKGAPYVEVDKTNPINVYGSSKLKGEQLLSQIMEQYFVLRTSWLYSQYGHNFLNTILKHAAAGKDLTITTAQVGTPTNANDLAASIWSIIISETKKYGVYHYSNAGESTWHGFAFEILKASGLLDKINLAKTDHYPTFAKRPAYSVLSTDVVASELGIKILSWKESLQQLINNIA